MLIDRANLIVVLITLIIAAGVSLAVKMTKLEMQQPSRTTTPAYNPCPIGGPNICESTYDGHRWHTVVKPKGCN